MKVKPLTLTGQFVRLEPMTLGHLNALCDVGMDESLWRWTPTQVESRSDMLGYIEFALGDKEKGNALPFVTIEATSKKVIGSTRFCAIDTTNGRAEIGWTWINPAWQRTAVNTEAKYLMLSHAFDTWGCHRVELKTDALNQQSRAAILRLGAKEEGIFRKHMITSSGRFRDSVYFSIIDSEWPDIKAEMESRLKQ